MSHLPSPSIENPKSTIENPPQHSLTLLLGTGCSKIHPRVLQFAALATRGKLPLTPALPDDPEAYLPPSLANFIPAPLTSDPASVLILNLDRLFQHELLSFNPDPARIFLADFPTFMPATRYIPTTSKKHPLYILHSHLRDNPAIRLVLLGNLPFLVGRQHPTLIPVLQDIAQIHQVALLASALTRPRPYPFLHHFTHIHTFPSFYQTYKLTSSASTPDHPPRGRPPQLLPDAIQWLHSQLASGPQPAAEIMDAARGGFGHMARTVHRAKHQLQISSFRVGPQWYWRLPPTPAQHDHSNFGNLEPTDAQGRTPIDGNLDRQPTLAQHDQPNFGNLEPTDAQAHTPNSGNLDLLPTLAQHDHPNFGNLEPTPAQTQAPINGNLDHAPTHAHHSESRRQQRRRRRGEP